MGKRKKQQQQPERDDQGNVVTPSPGTSKEAEQGTKKSRIHISTVHDEYEQTKYVTSSSS